MIIRKKRKRDRVGKEQSSYMIVGGCCITMKGSKYQVCEEVGGIPALVGGV